MVPDNDPTKQTQKSTGPVPPCICPHCGHSHGGYDSQASTVLDCLVLATEALSEAKRLVEAEVLP